jgi:uncharacterized membrane protein YeaQ/YmgE (transglycosylase-associated protein family)
MPQLDLLGWIGVGLLAGWLSSLVVAGRSARGCLPNVLGGVLGGVRGGYRVRELGFGSPTSFLGAIVVAFVGAVIVRAILNAVGPERR